MEINELIRILEENNYKNGKGASSSAWFSFMGKPLTKNKFHVDTQITMKNTGRWRAYYVKSNSLSLRLF